MNDEMIQIEKLEKELARLKEIVEAKKEKKIVFDAYNTLYIGLDKADGEPFILIGRDGRYCFYLLQNTERVYGDFVKTGQEAIDNAIDYDFEIHEFHNRIEGMEFFMEKYRKYHKED